MSTFFDPRRGLVMITVRFWGPTGDRTADLALDTGATASMISASLLVDAGYDPASATDRVLMTTASGTEYVARLPVDRIRALEQERQGFPILAHILPPSARMDGVLGLDFLRGQRLTVDFRAGEITLV